MSLIMDPVPPFFNSPSSSSASPSSYLHTLQRPLSNTTSAPHNAAAYSPSLHQSLFTAQNRGVSKTVPSQRSLSNLSAAARLESILPDQIRNQLPLSPGRSANTSWSSPRNSPRPHAFFEAPAPPVPQRQASTSSASSSWIVPTPPHSESGHIDSRAQSYASASPQPAPSFLSTTPGVMSVNYGGSSQFGPLGIDDSTLQSQNYSFDQSFRQSMPQHPTSQPYNYSQATAMGGSSVRTSSPVPLQPQYGEEYRLSSTYENPRPHPSTVVPSLPPSTSIGSNVSGYSSSGSPSMYDSSMYVPSLPSAQHMQLQSGMAYNQQMYNSPSVHSLPRSMSTTSNPSSERGSNQKPKPQCWDHGCNGRRFSTFSNLLRHQREKSGTATKSYCPKCGAEFTRTTARNGHLAHEKCSKQRKASPESK